MLEFLNKINNILLVLLVLLVILAIYSVNHDAFLQRLLDLVTGGFLTMAVGKAASAISKANTLENSSVETANITVTSPENAEGDRKQ